MGLPLRKTARIVDAHGREFAPDRVRRWEGAETNRLNAEQWRLATGQPINLDLQADLRTLRNRCIHEAANNPQIRGMIRTYLNDLIGYGGPKLQVQSDSKTYNEAYEDLWDEWWQMPDIAGMQAGVELMKQWGGGLWSCGEYLIQMISAKRAKTRVKLRLNTIHPRRLEDPIGMGPFKPTIMGIEIDEAGRPVRYHVLEEEPHYGGSISAKSVPIDAKNILHVFDAEEAGQLRGVPWLAAPLQPAADLRDYDGYVLEAARNAAANATAIWTNHPDLEPIAFDEAESAPIERGAHTMLPAGWQMSQITPTQPCAQYKEFRKEKQRDLGRPRCMPLMTIRQDAENYNYSSARFEMLGYVRALEADQGWMERAALNKLARLVAREGELGKHLPQRPERVELSWTWPKLANVDPEKEAKAERVEIETGTLPYSVALERRGTTLEETIIRRKRDNEALQEAGLPALPTPKAEKAEKQENSEENDHGTDANGEKKGKS